MSKDTPSPKQQICELCGDPAEERFLIVIRYYSTAQTTLEPKDRLALNLWVCEDCRDQCARFHKPEED